MKHGQVPRHIAIIMDGNGRWAERRGMARSEGHRRGMAVLRSVISYVRPALLGDRVHIATWLLPGDGRLRVARRFQVCRESDGVTFARAQIEYVCIELSSGRPTRWPVEFRERYVPLTEVVSGLDTLAPV